MKVYKAFSWSSNDWVDSDATDEAYFASKDKAEEYADLHLMYIAKKYAMADSYEDFDVNVDKKNRCVDYYDNNWEHITFHICITEIEVIE